MSVKRETLGRSENVKNFWKKKKEKKATRSVKSKELPQTAGHGGLTRVDTGNRARRLKLQAGFSQRLSSQSTFQRPAAFTQQDQGGARREPRGWGWREARPRPGRDRPWRAPQGRLRGLRAGAAVLSPGLLTPVGDEFFRAERHFLSFSFTCASILFPCLYVPYHYSCFFSVSTTSFTY